MCPVCIIHIYTHIILGLRLKIFVAFFIVKKIRCGHNVFTTRVSPTLVFLTTRPLQIVFVWWLWTLIFFLSSSARGKAWWLYHNNKKYYYPFKPLRYIFCCCCKSSLDSGGWVQKGAASLAGFGKKSFMDTQTSAWRLCSSQLMMRHCSKLTRKKLFLMRH